ncbi:hypothetical protein U3516DRAFT_778084 [Neocallimastix sp. 'constans']
MKILINAVKFTVYNYDKYYNFINPSYTLDNIIKCFETPEALAKYMGPTIYGISIKGNNTFVDSFGNYHYFNETQTDNRLKAPKSTKKHSKVIRNTNDIREINKLDTKDNFRSYYNKLYNTLIDNTAHCVPLAVIIKKSTTSSIDNIIYTRGSSLFDDPNVQIEGEKNDFLHIPKSCTFRIHYLSNSRSETYNRSYGVSDSTSDSLSDEISNTIDKSHI